MTLPFGSVRLIRVTLVMVDEIADDDPDDPYGAHAAHEALRKRGAAQTRRCANEALRKRGIEVSDAGEAR